MALFDLFFRRRRLPKPVAPDPSELGKNLNAMVDETVAAYNVPGWFAESFKADLLKAGAVSGAYRPSFEAGSVSPVEVDLVGLFTDPLDTLKKTGQAIAGVSKWSDFLPSINLAQELGLTQAEHVILGNLFRSQWVNAAGASVVPRSLQDSSIQWVFATSIRVKRLAREGLLKSNPGLAIMMGSALQRAGVTQIGGMSLVDFLSRASDAESGQLVNFTRSDGTLVQVSGLAGCLEAAKSASENNMWKEADFFWSQAEGIYARWAGTYGKLQPELIKEFERQMATLGGSPEAQFWRYWQLRNWRYATLNFLKTWHKSGPLGVFYSYVWQRMVKYLGLWYPPTFINKKIVEPLLRPLLTKLTAVRTTLTRLRKQFITEPIKKAAKGVLRWLGEKLGLKALGAAIGSALPGAGTAAGAVIGAVAQFLLDVVVEKLAKSALNLTLIVIGGSLAFCLATFVGMALFFVIILVCIMNVNAAFPGEGGINDPLFSPYSTTVLITKEVCEVPAGQDSCSNFSSPLRIEELDDSTHTVMWRIVLSNISSETQTVTFSDERCLTSGGEGVTLAPGEGGTYKCTQDIVADDDKVVTNVVSGIVTSDASPLSAVGVVIIGDPGIIYPSGWPTVNGCITQGPGGSFSHSRLQAIDIAASMGTPIFSTHDGVVTKVHTGCSVGGSSNCGGGYGNFVRVQSAAGFSTIYAHLHPGSITVRNGDTVSFMQQIGRMDHTGYSTGSHLHYEFRGLKMAPPYIPISVGPCSSGAECGFCL